MSRFCNFHIYSSLPQVSFDIRLYEYSDYFQRYHKIKIAELQRPITQDSRFGNYVASTLETYHRSGYV